MERLTLNEAIKHAKEVADMNYNDAEKFDSNDSVENYMKANCMKCAEEHEQLVEWLEELKFYKEAEEQGFAAQYKEEPETAAGAEVLAEDSADIESQEEMVGISATGSKYHSIPDCGNMNPDKAYQEPLSQAEAQGYEACKKCF